MPIGIECMKVGMNLDKSERLINTVVMPAGLSSDELHEQNKMMCGLRRLLVNSYISRRWVEIHEDLVNPLANCGSNSPLCPGSVSVCTFFNIL